MFMSSIILGIAALVAINSFNYNLVKDIERQSASLLGADLAITGNQPLKESQIDLLKELPGDASLKQELFSMSFIPKADKAQFVRIKAIEGGYPFYGKFLTEPAEAATQFKEGKGVILDDGLMLENDLQLGDSITLGDYNYAIIGRAMNTLGGVGLGSSFAPPVYTSKAVLQETNLIQPGSIVEYSYYQKLPSEFDVEAWKKENKNPFENNSMRVQTLEDQRRGLSQAFDNLNSFLNLVALVSLLLGCIGVASSVFIYVKNKIPSIAVFRCLGMKGRDAFLVYFIQIFALGLIGVVIGATLGSIIQIMLPEVLKDFLPYEVHLSLSWPAIIEGLIVGMTITMLFALLPLISVRNISPLRTLRASFEEATGKVDGLRWLVYAGIVGTLFLFLLRMTGAVRSAGVFTLGLLIAFGVLYGVSLAITWLIKHFFPTSWSFVFRQGLANLYRPNNQTATLIVSIGLGTAVLTTLFVIQGLLLQNVASMEAGNQPNMILFGIEKEQKEPLEQLTREFDMPVIQQVPIVTMRIAGWKGRKKESWLADSTRTASRWVINREARVTFRDTLDSDEILLEGTFTGEVQPGDSVWISVEKDWAESLGVGLGEEIEWNVQGTLIKTYVGSFRQIEFRSMRTRFFVVFPKGVLEKAPQFQVLVTKSPSNEVTARYRRSVVQKFPNVSAIDLGSILTTLSDILNKVSYIIQFMAGFSILTGLIVLISSLLLSKFQRIKESVLLRTIGASRNQIWLINATEYALLGGLSAAIGIVLSLIGSYFLAVYELELDFTLNFWPIILVFVFVVGLTITIGLLNSQEVVRRSPLEVLRRVS